MEQLITVGQEVGISAELKEFVDQVIVPALVERLVEKKDLDTRKPVPYEHEGAQTQRSRLASI